MDTMLQKDLNGLNYMSKLLWQEYNRLINLYNNFYNVAEPIQSFMETVQSNSDFDELNAYCYDIYDTGFHKLDIGKAAPQELVDDYFEDNKYDITFITIDENDPKYTVCHCLYFEIDDNDIVTTIEYTDNLTN